MSRNHARLNAAHWRRVRRRVLARDNWRCRSCGRPARLECDHVVPIDKGGSPWALDNLQSLCGGRNGCHAKKTAGENRRKPTASEAAWRALVAERMGT